MAAALWLSRAPPGERNSVTAVAPDDGQDGHFLSAAAFAMPIGSDKRRRSCRMISLCAYVFAAELVMLVIALPNGAAKYHTQPTGMRPYTIPSLNRARTGKLASITSLSVGPGLPSRRYRGLKYTTSTFPAAHSPNIRFSCSL